MNSIQLGSGGRWGESTLKCNHGKLLCVKALILKISNNKNYAREKEKKAICRNVVTM